MEEEYREQGSHVDGDELADESSGRDEASMIESNQVKTLQKALLEVVNKNELLQSEVELLRKELENAKLEIEGKDKAILELAQALDDQMQGKLQDALDQI